MLCIEPSVASVRPHWFATSQWEGLESIHDPRVNLGILARNEHRWKALSEILASDFKSTAMVFETGDDPMLIGAELDQTLNLVSEDAFEFSHDVMATASRFALLSRRRFIGIKFERIDFDNCRSFHVDYISLRLICTYSGPGTEWLHDADVTRSGLGRNDNEKVVTQSAQVQKVAPQSIVVLKGENYPGAAGRGLVHRSPAIAQLGLSRLLLRIDALDEYS